MSSRRPTPLLARMLGITPDEAPRVVPAAAFQLVFVAGVAVLKTVASALVVARFDASTLAWLLLGAALVAGLAAAVDGALRSGGTPPRKMLLASAVVTALLGAGAASSSSAAVVALYLFAEAYATVASVRFWASLGEAFDPRESKRVFAVVGGFGMGGLVLGGLVGGLGGVVGAVPVLGFALASMVACAWLASIPGRRKRTISSVELPAAAGSSPRPDRLLRLRELAGAFGSDRYLALLVLFAALAAALTVVADFLFRVAARGASEDELAVLFGASNLVLGVCAMAFQLFLAGRVLTRFGVFRYLGLVPAGTAALGVACAVHPGLAPAFALKVVESLGSLSLHPTGMQLLYAPLSDGTRVAARALVDGMVKKGGAAIGGAALVLWNPLAAGEGLAAAVVAASVAVLAVLVLLRRAYVARMDARLSRARWTGAVALDAESRALLIQRLGDPDPSRVLMAAELLAVHRASPGAAWVGGLLAHSSDWVRTRGVKLAAELGLRELLPRLRQIASGDVRRPRDEAVLAIARLDRDAAGFLAPLLLSGDPGLRAAAIAALLPLERERGFEEGPAARSLRGMLEARDASVAERRELARLLGRLGGAGRPEALDALLDDPDVSVRRLAVVSVGECGRAELAPRLVELLADRELRREARGALAAMGDRVADLIEAALHDRARPAPVRCELPRLLRYLGTPRAAEILLASCAGDDPFLRYRVALALSRMRRTDPNLPFDCARVTAEVVRRVEAYVYYLPIFRDLQEAFGDRAILVRALAGRLDQGFEIAFRLLGLLFPARSMMNVYHRLVEGDARERAYAIELFEHLVDEVTRSRVLPLIERWHRGPSDEGEIERVPARLMELAVSKDPILRACARHAWRGEGRESLPGEDDVKESVIEKVFLLEGVSIFERCGVDDLAVFAAIAHERRFAAGATIYRENDPGDSLFVIVEGRVLLEKEGRVILQLGEKEAFGDVSLLDGLPRPNSARAVEDTRALVIDRQDFLDVLSDRPEVLKGLFAVLTRQMRQMLQIAAAKDESQAASRAAG